MSADRVAADSLAVCEFCGEVIEKYRLPDEAEADPLNVSEEPEQPAPTVDLTLHIPEAIESGDDLIVAVGGYPLALQNQEKTNILSLMDAVKHDG